MRKSSGVDQQKMCQEKSLKLPGSEGELGSDFWEKIPKLRKGTVAKSLQLLS
jgi:hypothetical protein